MVGISVTDASDDKKTGYLENGSESALIYLAGRGYDGRGVY